MITSSTGKMIVGTLAVLATMAAMNAAEAVPTTSNGVKSEAAVTLVAKGDPVRKIYKKRVRNQRLLRSREAHRRNRYHYRNGVRIFGAFVPGISITVGPSYRSRNYCRTSYRNWQETGSRYWRRRYYECRNG